MNAYAVISGLAFKESKRSSDEAERRLNLTKSGTRSFIFAAQDARILNERFGIIEAAAYNLSVRGD